MNTRPFLCVRKSGQDVPFWDKYEIDELADNYLNVAVTINKSISINMGGWYRTILLANVMWAKPATIYRRYLLNEHLGNTHIFMDHEDNIDIIQDSRNNFYPLTGTTAELVTNDHHFIYTDTREYGIDEPVGDGGSFLLHLLMGNIN
jgi:hypothetical protein